MLCGMYFPPTALLIPMGYLCVTFFRNFSRFTVAISVPNNLPQGFNSSIRSNRIFNTPVSGMEINMPETPHIAPPNKTTTIEISALIFTLDETMKGTSR